jgi:hypothetical protein
MGGCGKNGQHQAGLIKCASVAARAGAIYQKNGPLAHLSPLGPGIGILTCSVTASSNSGEIPAASFSNTNAVGCLKIGLESSKPLQRSSR